MSALKMPGSAGHRVPSHAAVGRSKRLSILRLSVLIAPEVVIGPSGMQGETYARGIQIDTGLYRIGYRDRILGRRGED